jgi:hypothetical protein
VSVKPASVQLFLKKEFGWHEPIRDTKVHQRVDIQSAAAVAAEKNPQGAKTSQEPEPDACHLEQKERQK